MSINLRLLFDFCSVNENEAPSVRTAASLFQEMCYQNKDNLSAGIIVAGWDKKDGPSVYNVPLGGSLHKAPFAIGGKLSFNYTVKLSR
jgi:20S proteasome subunit beta 1